MEQNQSSPIRFGTFEVDIAARELRRGGFKVKLQDQPFHVLVMLLESPGQIVTRDELQKKLWPADTFVDFERGLNRAINKLREALIDDADNPRFIETLPRRGYRLLAAVETVGKAAITLPEIPPQTLTGVSTAARSGRLLPFWAIAAAVAAIAVIVFAKQWRSLATVADRPFLQLDLYAGPDEISQPAISPDGMRIVFVSKRGLIVRRLDQSQPMILPGTEGASYPFFSPNGQWVAFFADHKLQKVSLEGGTPIPLCDAPSASGGSWGSDDGIIAALDLHRGLFRVSAAGGVPRALTDPRTDPASTVMHRWPQALPGGKGVLFAAVDGSWQGSLRILTPNDGKIKTVVENSTNGRFLESGYLVYYQRETLFVAPMDLKRLELTGPARHLVYAVANSVDRADFDISSGTLVYRRGTQRNSLPSWLYSSGKTEPVLAKAGYYLGPRLSPDGTRLALSVIEGSKQSLWVYDITRESFNRLTSGDDPELLPTWTPDGEILTFRSGNNLVWTQSDGSGKVKRLAGFSRNAGPGSFSADGNWLAFWPLQPGSDLWAVPVKRAAGALQLGQPRPLLQQAGSKGAPAISPDSRWLAYTSDASGRFEIYVIPFSPETVAAGRKWLVSNGGGFSPVWSSNGRELFYQRPDRRVGVAAYIVKGDSFVPDKPALWSEKQMVDIGFWSGFDVAPDGKRVLALFASGHETPETSLHVMLNLDSELRRRMRNN
jgi:Tol biopolymer transport system component/DNA-binding winged helix-turn-helix (wHTH) protein